MPVIFARRWIWFLLSFGLCVSAWGHATGEGYVFVDIHADRIDGRFECHFDDLERVLNLKPGKDEDAEAFVAANVEALRAYLLTHFELGRADAEEALAVVFTKQTGVIDIPQGRFAQVPFVIRADAIPERLAIQSTMFFEGAPRHRNLLLVNYNQRTDTHHGEEHTALIFSPGNAAQELDLNNIPSVLRPRAFIWQGILHIWIGIDHILFLVALILPSVLRRQDGRWVPVPTFKQAFWNILKIVTLFTIAHSITLSLAALDFIRLPSRLVESIIALSIVVVAANNLCPKFNEKSWVLIVLFGLFHGLGFASVMGVLPFRIAEVVKVVLGFNIGVEIGQVVIVLICFPVLFLLRKWLWYNRAILVGGSIVVGLVAAYWFVERAFGLR